MTIKKLNLRLLKRYTGHWYLVELVAVATLHSKCKILCSLDPKVAHDLFWEVGCVSWEPNTNYWRVKEL